jgi:transposase-like protein
MQESEDKQVRRSQRDYSLAFKLAVVGEVARGELSKKQAKHRYGIQDRSTVLVWCRKYASHFATFQQAGRTFPGAPRPVEQTPEQRIKQLETQLRDQKRQYEKQLQDSAALNLLLRTMLQVVEEDHDIPLPKKSFQRPLPVSKPPKK